MASENRTFFVYINGYPGVGKLTVAHALKLVALLCPLANHGSSVFRAILENTKVFDNHKLIDVTAAIFERDMPEYRPHRQQLVR